MNVRVTTLATTLLLFAAGSGIAGEAPLAWQNPGFVMEEVIVTAPAPADPAELAWQQADYVMEEVVVTASASEFIGSAQSRIPAPLRLLIAAHMRHQWMQHTSTQL
jgi:hypothetical protein